MALSIMENLSEYEPIKTPSILINTLHLGSVQLFHSCKLPNLHLFHLKRSNGCIVTEHDPQYTR